MTKDKETEIEDSLNSDYMENWSRLAAAVVLLAIKDYEAVKYKIKKNEQNMKMLPQGAKEAYLYEHKILIGKKHKIENFFRSQWCEGLIFLGSYGFIQIENGDVLEKVESYVGEQLKNGASIGKSRRKKKAF